MFGSIIQDMVIDMNEARLNTVAQLAAFLEGTPDVDFRSQDDDGERYAFIGSVVARLARYSVLRGWHVLGVSASPLRGPKGNREFFLHISSQGRTAANIETLINRTVEALA